MSPPLFLPLALALALAPRPPVDGAGKLADAYVGAVREVNEKHARKPGATTEDELAEELPRKAQRALEELLESRADAAPEALARCAEAALELARVEDFERARARLEELAPERAAELGTALVRPRFLLRGLNGLDEAYLEHFAAILEPVLAGYDEVFGFREWSKVPGKKLRVRVHLEEQITRPPHFAPQFDHHSEIDFPVVDKERLRSPTADGKFLFYGLCHELGHVIAMWGRPGHEEDHHAWAHYTGLALMDHLAAAKDPALAELRDVRWRSLAKEQAELAAVEPSLETREGTLVTLFRLHEALGSKAIGDAIDLLDEKDARLRVHRVRYYTFRELGQGLREVVEDRNQRKLVDELLP